MFTLLSTPRSLPSAVSFLAVPGRDVKTTIVYTHVLNRGGRGVHSPLDRLRMPVSAETRRPWTPLLLSPTYGIVFARYWPGSKIAR